MDLIIVESPTKARTLGRFLGDSKYRIAASYGHIRDLPEKKIGVDIEHQFEPVYVQTDKQKERLKEIKHLSDEAETVYLATDPDREGEAIAWHVEELIKGKSKKEKFKRIEFHEITKGAIEQALTHPRQIDQELVDAQQARRIVDRLVGYKLSPLLWRKVRRGLSAGRVQSVALRLIVEKEREIEAFKPEEYWDLLVEVKSKNSKGKGGNFKVKLAEKNEEKLKVGNQTQAEEIEAELRSANYQVAGVDKKDFKRTPPAPFTTSTLQQTAANRLGWSAKKTMQVAQSLYEEGLITYHRTDSTNMAVEAITNLGNFIISTFGKEYGIGEPRLYATKNKVAQEAHEAIRPTDPSVSPDSLLTRVNRDQERLYDLIWKRFVATQMAEARGVSVKISVEAKAGNKYLLLAKGEILEFDGWQKLYLKSKKEETDEEDVDTDNQQLPEVDTGEGLDFVELFSEQKFTQPPARFNDASLIKKLEEMGIGRPSTYAPTLSTIQDRQYVEKIEKRFKPTAIGIAVSDFLVANFPVIVDYQFTAKMEDDLDAIANGERKWREVAADFYGPFEKTLEKTGDAARVKIDVESTGEKCPLCGEGEVVVRLGKFGKFLSCSRYPDCVYKAQYVNKTGQKCPKCNEGDVIMRKTKTGKTFYGCSNYPNCDFASWNKPEIKPTV